MLYFRTVVVDEKPGPAILLPAPGTLIACENPKGPIAAKLRSHNSMLDDSVYSTRIHQKKKLWVAVSTLAKVDDVRSGLECVFIGKPGLGQTLDVTRATREKVNAVLTGKPKPYRAPVNNSNKSKWARRPK